MKNILVIPVMVLGCLPAFAATYRSDITVLQDDVVYDIRPDASFTVDEVEVVRIETEQGVKQYSQISLYYSASLADMAVDEAYTTSRDGKRIDVAPDKIIVQQSPQSAGAPMFDDGKVKTVVFPAVQVGATVTLHYHKVQKTPLFPGQFSMREVAEADIAIKSSTVTVNAPATMELHVDAVDMPGGRLQPASPDRQAWRWKVENTVAHAPEAGSVAVADYSPRVAVTTFPNYESAARAYLERAEPKAAVTPAIRKLADEITHGVADRRTQAELIYRWVSQNIRYVAIYLDFGGVVPHDAPSIAEARYGDCKDHTTLLEALLAAKGIQGYPVLINASASYSLPKVAVTPGTFDHAITYLPEFKLFVDSTSDLAMFGELPMTEYGKQALVTNDGTGQPRIMRLPLFTPESGQVDIRTRLTVDGDGGVTGSSEVSNRGVFDWFARQTLAGVPQGAEPQVVGRALALSGQSGTGNYTSAGLRDLTRPFAYATSFSLPNYVQLPGPGAMMIPAGFTSFSNIAAAIQVFDPERRETPIVQLGRRISESTSVKLPPGMVVSALPRGADLSSPLGTYKSSYALDGSSIIVTRVLTMTPTDILGTVEDYQTLRTLARGINKDLRSQVVFSQ